MRAGEAAQAEQSTSEPGALARAIVAPLPAESLQALLTVGQVAEYLNVPRQRLYDWRWRGEGPPAFKVGQSLRYRLADVEAWLEAQREPA